MENRAHAIVAVSFLIVCSIGVVVVYYWIAGPQAEPRYYRIVTGLSVGGLQAQSPVTFKGLLVGHVQRIDLAEERPAKVEILFSARREVPVTESTYAVLASQGIVGGTALALKLGEGSREPLPTSREDPARIPLREGLLAQLKSKAVESLSRMNDVLKRLQALLDKDNRRHVDAILAQLDTASRKLVKIERRLLPAVKALPGLLQQVQKTLAQSRTFLQRASRLAQAAQQPLDQFGAAAESAQAFVQDLRRQLLPEITRLSDSLARTSRALRQLSQQLQAHPGSLIFGAPEPPPGPGEPGFGRSNE